MLSEPLEGHGFSSTAAMRAADSSRPLSVGYGAETREGKPGMIFVRRIFFTLHSQIIRTFQPCSFSAA